MTKQAFRLVLDFWLVMICLVNIDCPQLIVVIFIVRTIIADWFILVKSFLNKLKQGE